MGCTEERPACDAAQDPAGRPASASVRWPLGAGKKGEERRREEERRGEERRGEERRGEERRGVEREKKGEDREETR